MWKSRLFCFLLLASSFGVNATDYTPGWSISGIDNVTGLYLDLDVGSYSIAAHGSLRLENDVDLSAVGTCFVTPEGGVACTIVVVKGITLQFFIDDHLNGTITEYSSLGSKQQTGAITFLGL